MIRFIHIPKTAGQSVIKWLEENEIEFSIGTRKNYKGLHKPAKYFLEEDVSRFSVVRNPYDRLVSYYTYYNRIANETNNTDWKIAFEDLVDSLSWNVEDEENFMNWPAKIPHHRLTQMYHITDDCGNIIVENILYFEKIEKDLENLFGSRKNKLKQINSSNSVDYRSFYTQDLAEKVYEHFKKDFKVLGYSKELL